MPRHPVICTVRAEYGVWRSVPCTVGLESISRSTASLNTGEFTIFEWIWAYSRPVPPDHLPKERWIDIGYDMSACYLSSLSVHSLSIHGKQFFSLLSHSLSLLPFLAHKKCSLLTFRLSLQSKKDIRITCMRRVNELEKTSRLYYSSHWPILSAAA